MIAECLNKESHLTFTNENRTLIHPKGEIKADFRMGKKTLEGQVVLPKGVSGLFVYDIPDENVRTMAETVNEFNS